VSGIVGIYNRDQQMASSKRVEAMLDTIRYRGPEGLRVQTLDAAAFGHAMLHTTRESLHETLPAISSSGSLMLTADARIDNRDELLDLLAKRAENRIGVTDSHLILLAYETWGEKCVDHLVGDFAFAIYDSERQGVFCARDHFGVKPFYYALTDQEFAFATDQKALLELDWVDDSSNRDTIESYLIGFVDSCEETFYNGITRLPPAHTMFVGSVTLQRTCYWRLDPHFELKLESTEQYVARFRALFDEAVKCRLRSAPPVGALLSGGLDSSSIVCVAAPHLHERGEQLHTFSAIYPHAAECDERPYIDSVTSTVPVTTHALDTGSRSLYGEVRRVAEGRDEPIVGIGHYSSSWMYELAHETGVRVVLDGHDGDSTVSHGWGYLRELAYAKRWSRLYRESAGLALAYNYRKLDIFWNYFQYTQIKPLVARHKPLQLATRVWSGVKRRLPGKKTAPKQRLSKWKHLKANSSASDSPVRMRYRKMTAWYDDYRTERGDHYIALTQPMHAWALESLDKTAATHQVEARYPFWDKRLVEFCLSVPADLKLSDGWGRWIMRSAMDGILPAKVQWRRGKTDFAGALSVEAYKDRDELEAAIVEVGTDYADYIDADAVRDTMSQFCKEPTTEAFAGLFPVLGLHLWQTRNKMSRRGAEPAKQTFAKS
jgi:asparagine synthase (glutamine-hydrolysing)